jgi:hypothetical protein
MKREAEFPLRLTSPHMRGRKVRRAQEALKKYRPGRVDGEWGQKSAAATKRAKFWLGYPQHAITGTYGEQLHRRLTGKSSLPLSYRARRARRLKAHADRPLREKALEIAKQNLGEKEHPEGSNHSKFNEWYGFDGAWCAMFVSFCYVKAGSEKAFVRAVRYAFTPFMTRDARQGDHALRTLGADEVKPGDVVMFDWGFDGRSQNVMNTDHTGLFEKWLVRGQSFMTIEGNTSIGNDSDGGRVMRRTRGMREVEAFIRVEA